MRAQRNEAPVEGTPAVAIGASSCDALVEGSGGELREGRWLRRGGLVRCTVRSFGDGIGTRQARLTGEDAGGKYFLTRRDEAARKRSNKT